MKNVAVGEVFEDSLSYYRIFKIVKENVFFEKYYKQHETLACESTSISLFQKKNLKSVPKVRPRAKLVKKTVDIFTCKDNFDKFLNYHSVLTDLTDYKKDESYVKIGSFTEDVTIFVDFNWETGDYNEV